MCNINATPRKLAKLFTKQTLNEQKNRSGIPLSTYNDAIRKISSYYGAKVMDLYNCGITASNLLYYTVDNEIHPNEAGMNLMNNKILQGLIGM